MLLEVFLNGLLPISYDRDGVYVLHVELLTVSSDRCQRNISYRVVSCCEDDNVKWDVFS